MCRSGRNEIGLDLDDPDKGDSQHQPRPGGETRRLFRSLSEIFEEKTLKKPLLLSFARASARSHARSGLVACSAVRRLVHYGIIHIAATTASAAAAE